MRMRLDRNADAYLLTERELKVLLAGQNNDFVFGLLSDKAAECSETKADVYTALADMVRMEKISTDGESFRIAEPIASCVRQIGAAETVGLLSFCDEDYPTCCYVLDDVVTCRRVRYQPEILRVKKYSKREFNDVWLARFDDGLITGDVTEEALWSEAPAEYFSFSVYRSRELTVRISVSAAPLSSPEIVVLRRDGGDRSAFSKEALSNLIDYYFINGLSSGERSYADHG